jgi:hypothetical protein
MNTTARTIANQNCLFGMSFASVYPLDIAKAQTKDLTKADVDAAIRWLTGCTARGLEAQISEKKTFEEFSDSAPKINPARDQMTGLICGVRVEEIARGRTMAKILRAPA